MSGLLLTFHHFLMLGGWVVIWLGDFFLRHVPPHSRRMQRGKYFRWTIRTFGLMADAPPRIFLAVAMVAFFITTHQDWPLDVFYTFLAVTAAVDWITGSDDPPWRRWKESASAALKKLRIQPAPQPVIDM